MGTEDEDFMEWLVLQRSENQASCLELHKLLTKHAEQWKQGDYFFASVSLVGAAFSLWRAVFLADKREATRTAVFDHSIKFLETMILDNAISYATDKRNNEITFNYYSENARLRLIDLTVEWPKLLEPWEYKLRDPKPRWEYNQRRLNDAIRRFGIHLEKLS